MFILSTFLIDFFMLLFVLSLLAIDYFLFLYWFFLSITI